MPVTRCICHNITFAELHTLSQQLTAQLGIHPDSPQMLETLRARTGCTSGCGTCLPYVKVMLKTGHTSLPVLTSQQVERILSTPLPRAPTG